MNGVEIIHQIKKRWPKIVCILFTAYISFELAKLSLDDPDIYRYVEKPMDFLGEEFRALLAGAIEEHQKLSSK